VELPSDPSNEVERLSLVHWSRTRRGRLHLLVGVDAEDGPVGHGAIDADRLRPAIRRAVAGAVADLDADVELVRNVLRHLPDVAAGVLQVGGDRRPRAVLA